MPEMIYNPGTIKAYPYLRQVHELCHTWLSGPTSCNVVGGQNEEQTERATRIKLARRSSENDNQATDAKREEEVRYLL